MYKIGDKIFYPMHGAGVIEDLVEKEVLGEIRKYFVVGLVCNSVKISIPYDNAEKVGLRPIIDEKSATQVVYAFGNEKITEHDNWNVRYRENLEKIKSNSIHDISLVVKELMLRDKRKPLSTGERKMLASAKNILISELGLSLGKTYAEIDNALLAMIDNYCACVG